MSKKTRINYTPVAGYLLLKPLESVQPKGFTIEGVDEKPQLAKVIKTGKATWYENSERMFKPPCKVGDVIVHSSVGFENVNIEGEEYRLLPFSRVLMVKI